MTRAERAAKVEPLQRKEILIYNIENLENLDCKGNPDIKVLHKILLQEINKHNGSIKKRINKIINQGTSD